MTGGGPTLRLEIARRYLPLLQPARFKGAYGGRGSGKSHTFAQLLVARAVAQPGLRWACGREVQKDLKESVKLLIEDKIRLLGLSGVFDIVQSEIRTPGGGVIIFRGMTDYSADGIKSLEGFDGVWLEEAHTISSRSLEMLIPTIRKPGSEIWASWNPRRESDPIDQLLRGPSRPKNAIVIEANYSDNPWLPDELRQAEAYDRLHNPVRHAHIWLGAYEPQAIGAIWSAAVLDAHRVTAEAIDHPMMAGHRRRDAVSLGRIVVAVDPAVSGGDGGDETGIVVVGHGANGHAYLLEDASMKGTPAQWAAGVVEAYDRWGADLIVAERNQGGLMVRHTLDSIRTGLPIRMVWAARGKHVRAEPIAARYEAGQVHHVGAFDALEAQMVLMTAGGYEGDGSPDRVDALVWAMTEMFPVMGQGQVYTMDWDDIAVPPQAIPNWWPRVYAVRVVGESVWALWGALDPAIDCLYVYTEHRRRQAEPSVHAAAVAARGVSAGTFGTDDGSERLHVLYRSLGLRAQATAHPVDTEATINAVTQRLSTGRLKVMTTCAELAAAYRLYRRDEQGRPIEEGRWMSCLADMVTQGVRIASVAGSRAPSLIAAQHLPADPKSGY